MMASNDRNNSETFIFEGLNKKQANTIPLLVNPKYKTYGEVAKEAGVSERSIYNWLNDERFVEVLNEQIEKFTDAENARVWKSLVRQATEGDVRAIKLYFEMKGKYKQRHEVTGRNGGPIKYKEMSDEELLKEAEKYGINVETKAGDKEKNTD